MKEYYEVDYLPHHKLKKYKENNKNVLKVDKDKILITDDESNESKNKENYNKLDNTARIDEDNFDSKSFNFDQNYNFNVNKEHNLFIDNYLDEERGEEKRDQIVIELNKFNLPIKGFARIIEKNIFCKVLYLKKDYEDNEVTEVMK